MNRTITLFPKLFLSTAFLCFFHSAQAQLLQTIDATNNGPYTPQSLISNILLGDGVTVTSVLYNGSPRAVGYFSGGTQSIGIERGIIMTTGLAGKPAAPSNGPTSVGSAQASNGNGSSATDANLSAIATLPLSDVAVYTITFIPTSDTLRFRYCFASEEYPEFACTEFNDLFGFFIQGPGYPTPTNIARVPGTPNLPVTINNIHPLNNAVFPTCQPFNAQYYNSNLGSTQQPVYDGYTDVFTAMAVVTPCQPYTIKLAIADVSDALFDSGVFLEAKSFGTTALRVAVNTPSADGSIAEGCLPASVTFSLADPINHPYPINLNILGSATPGIDFQSLPNNLVIPTGQTQITLPIAAIEDGLTEPMEVIAFDVQIDACNRDTVYLHIRDNPILPPLMQDTTLCSIGSPIQLNATVPVPTPPAPTFSNTQDVAIQDNNAAATSTINVAGVQPVNLGQGVVRAVCVNIAHNNDDDLDFFLVSPGGQILELSTDNGGSGNNYTNTCFTPTAANAITFPGPQAPSTAAPFTGNYLPEGTWSDLWDTPNRPTNGNWSIKASDDFSTIPPSPGTLLDWSITFAPSYEVTYQWAASPDIACLSCPVALVSPLVSSTYAVTATDTYGCTVTADLAVEITNLVATAGITDEISCFGNANGTAAVGVNIGGANTYLWSDPAAQTSAEAANLGAGSYTVTVTNPGGCSATSSVTLTQPPVLNLSASGQDAACFGQPSGTASALATGGTAPYEYVWSNGLTSPTLPSLLNGAYSVTVTDANGCSAIENISINQPSALQLSINVVVDAFCFNSADGQISLTSGGGVSPVTFQWNTGQSGPAINGLAAGTYTVTMTDANGCTNSLQQSITQPNDLAAFATPKAVRCFGENNGELHLDVNGGTPTYTVSWQGPNGFSGSGIDLLQLTAGNYVATVTDINGCTEIMNTAVIEPPVIVLDLPTVADTICFAAANGTATVSATGGSAPFSFLWDANGQTTATATGLSSQEYHLTVTDAKGCSQTAKTVVPQKQELNAFAQPTLPNCHNGADGSATVLSIFYGVTPANTSSFQYTWNTSPVQHNITATNLKANQSYLVTVSDVDGCTAQYGFVMGNPIEVEAAITGSGEVKCHGAATGWAAANAFGGTQPYTWFWGAGSTPTDSVAQGLSAGLTRVTITDARGCPDIVSVTIEEPEPLQVQLLPTHVKCFGETTGSAKAIASGGTSPYSYLWWGGQQTIDVQGVAAGTYGLTITDGNGCATPNTVEITQPATPVSAMIDIREPRCFGDHNGQVIFTPAGGTPPYRYALDERPFNGSTIQIGLTAGVYDPKIMDINGCIALLPPVEVTQQEKITVDLGPDIRILLGQDTQLLAQVISNIGGYQLTWSPADSTWLSCLDCSNPSVYDLAVNHYFEVLATDSLGCRAEDQILISVEKPRRVFVPTAFSPNGDLSNDLLLVHGQKTSKVLVFRVYDRWGEMVYEAKDFPFNDENTGWDGTFKGQALDPGVFVWVLEVEYVDGVREVYKGDTTLIR